MSRLKVDSRIPQQYDAGTLLDIIREIAQQLNGLTEGQIVVVTNALTSIPTAGSYQQGDFVRKSNLVQAGAPGSKYVITGWNRLTSGSTHVLNTDWVEARVLTGN